MEAHPRPTESEFLEGEPRNLCFHYWIRELLIPFHLGHFLCNNSSTVEILEYLSRKDLVLDLTLHKETWDHQSWFAQDRGDFQDMQAFRPN